MDVLQRLDIRVFVHVCLNTANDDTTIDGIGGGIGFCTAANFSTTTTGLYFYVTQAGISFAQQQISLQQQQVYIFM